MWCDRKKSATQTITEKVFREVVQLVNNVPFDYLTIAPEDHVAAYVLLASSQSKTMTGTVIHTDAGRGVMTFNR